MIARRLALVGLVMAIIGGLLYAGYQLAPAVQAYADLILNGTTGGVGGGIARFVMENALVRALPGFLVAALATVGIVAVRRRTPPPTS